MCAVRQNLKEAQDTVAGASKELNHLHAKCADSENLTGTLKRELQKVQQCSEEKKVLFQDPVGWGLFSCCWTSTLPSGARNLSVQEVSREPFPKPDSLLMEGNVLLWCRERPALNSVHRHSKLSGCLFLSLAEECAVLRIRTSQSGFGVRGSFECPALLFDCREPSSLRRCLGGRREQREPRQSPALGSGHCGITVRVRGNRGIAASGSAFVPAGPGTPGPALPGAAALRPSHPVLLEEEQPRSSSRHRRHCPIRQ
ncbi:uncharacterized protein LOC117011514 [Catharus ustulatus]|uniref:uncharacterized protein LOC117011514 n=1 Tax=Catharus ustulatus TaxID=91951 RepID=UPI00140C5920|nr:uncharacterized protein LOC117011514 [Catharus ustulatus]